MYKSNEEYISKLNKAFDNNIGILSLKNFNETIDLDDESFKKKYDINEILERYDLKTAPFNSRTDVINHFLYYAVHNDISGKEADAMFYSFIIVSDEDPLSCLFKLLEESLYSYKIVHLIEILTCRKFSDLLFNQYCAGDSNALLSNLFFYNSENEKYLKMTEPVFTRCISFLKEKRLTTKSDIEVFIKKVCDEYGRANIWLHKSNDDEKDGSQGAENNKYQYVELNVLEAADKIISKWKTKSKDKKEKSIFSLSNLLNPESDFINDMYGKYSELLASFENDARACSILKTILYISSYLTRDKGYYPSVKMKNITSVETNWATKNEKTYDPSFYGQSEPAKAFAEYYAFMEGRRNPYYQIIDNKVVNYMDAEAMKMHKYFKDINLDNYIYDLFYEKELIGGQSMYDFLMSVRELISLIESPFLIPSIDPLTLIKDIVDSILNSVAQTLDFALSMSMKQLFYFKIIPIGDQVLSLADVYNYINFLKLILEAVNGDKSIEEIDREEFVNAAYQTLGIRKTYIDKSGYGAYDLEMISANGMSLFIENFYKTKDGVIFTAKNQFKIFYSCLQFALLKNAFLASDYNLLVNFDYSNMSLINKLISALSNEELYYLFSIYGLEIEEFKKIDLNNESSFDEFNEKVISITNMYNHENISFYQDYLNYLEAKNNTEAENYLLDEFKDLRFRQYLDKCIEEYRKAVVYNKEIVERTIFANANISDVDGFLMRFIPSMVEVMKVLEINDISTRNVVKILDYICYFMSDILFRNFFINLKCSLIDRIRNFSDNFFDKTLLGNKTIFKINIGGKSINEKIDEIIDMIDNFVLDTTVISNCFENPNFNVKSYSESKLTENKYYLDTYDLNGEKLKNRKNLKSPRDKWSQVERDSVKKSTLTENNKDQKNENMLNDIFADKEKKIPELFDEIKNTIGNTLEYINGEIFIVKPSGERIKVVHQNDEFIPNHSLILHNPQKIEKELIATQNEYELLIEVRDFISNIKNVDTIFLSNSIVKINQQIAEEREKNIPNFSKIRKLEEERAKLTNELENVKTDYNVYISNNDGNNLSASNNNIKNNHKSIANKLQKDGGKITISSNYQGIETASKKRELLKNVEEVAIENNLPLTTYEIIQLLQ